MTEFFPNQTVPAHKTKIMVHCAATQKTWAHHNNAAKGMATIARWHTDPKPKGRGWSAVAYAAGIDGRGGYALGRDLDGDGNVLEETGAGAFGHNRDTIHICLFGGHGASANDKFADHFTEAQEDTLRDMIEEIQAKAPHQMQVMGHNEVANKACPGFQVRPWLAKKPERTSPAQSTTMQASAAGAMSVVTGAGTAIAQLDGTAQIVVIVCAFIALAGLAWIMRERLKRWARGDR